MSQVRPDGSRFTVVRWREGYEIADVDSFLSQLTAGPTADIDVSAVRFTPTRLRPGYVMREVDEYLDAVANGRYLPSHLGSADAPPGIVGAPRARLVEVLRRLVTRRRFQLGIALVVTAVSLRLILGPGNNGVGCTDASIQRIAIVAVPLFTGLALLASMMPNRFLGSGRIAVVKWIILVGSVAVIAISIANIAGVRVGLAAGCQ